MILHPNKTFIPFFVFLINYLRQTIAQKIHCFVKELKENLSREQHVKHRVSIKEVWNCSESITTNFEKLIKI